MASFCSSLALSQRLFGILIHFGQLILIFVIFVGILLGLLFASLGLLLLGLFRFTTWKRDGVVSGILTAFLQLEGNEVHHQPSLEDADRNQSSDPENKGVEGSAVPVDDLLFGGRLGQAMPEGHHAQDDGAQTGQNEKHVVETINRPSYLALVGVRQEATGVEDCLSEVLENQETECHTSVGEHVRGPNKDQVQGGVADACRHVFFLDLLKVKFRVDVEPVGDLHNVKELEHEGHLIVRVAFPQLANAKKVFSHDDVTGPKKADNVEAQQLAALVKLGVLDLGQVEFPVDPIQKVLLDDLVHDNGDQQVKENSGEVLDSGGIVGHVGHPTRAIVHGDRDVVVQSDEERGQGRGHLKHQAHHKDHGHASHDVCVVLDDKFMAKDGRVFGAPPLDSHLDTNT